MSVDVAQSWPVDTCLWHGLVHCIAFLFSVFNEKILEKGAVLPSKSDLNRFKVEPGVSKNAKKAKPVENLMISIFQIQYKKFYQNHLLAGDFIPVELTLH